MLKFFLKIIILCLLTTSNPKYNGAIKLQVCSLMESPFRCQSTNVREDCFDLYGGTNESEIWIQKKFVQFSTYMKSWVCIQFFHVWISRKRGGGVVCAIKRYFYFITQKNIFFDIYQNTISTLILEFNLNWWWLECKHRTCTRKPCNQKM